MANQVAKPNSGSELAGPSLTAPKLLTAKPTVKTRKIATVSR